MDRMSGGSWWDTASHQTVGVIRCLHGYLCASVLEGTCRFDTSMVDAVVVGVDARFDVSFFFGGQLVPTPPTTLKDNGCQNNNRRTQPGVHTVVTPPLTPSAQSTQSAQPTYSAHSAPPPELHHTNGKTNTKEPRVFHSTTRASKEKTSPPAQREHKKTVPSRVHPLVKPTRRTEPTIEAYL